MADVTFDPVTRIIQVDTAPDSNGEVVLDVQQDIYSAGKDDWLAGSTLQPLQFAVRTIGGDPVTATQNAGITYFLQYGWRIRPYEADHRFVVIGNLRTDPFGFSPFIDTVGSFNIRIENQVSNLVDSSVARLDLTQVLPAVYIDVANGTSGTAEGVGTPTNPSNNITDARTIADRDMLREFRFRGAITLNQSYTSWTFIGLSAEGADTIALNGQNVDSSRFDECKLIGSMSGRIDLINCGVDAVVGFDGVARNTGLISSVTLSDGADATFHQCFSEIPGNNRPTLFLGAGNTITGLNVRAYSGGLTIEDVNEGSENISVDVVSGTIEVAASCTGGTVVVRGVGKLVNNANGTTVNPDGFIDARYFTGKQISDYDAGTYQIRDVDDDAVVLDRTVTITGTPPSSGSVTVDKP